MAIEGVDITPGSGKTIAVDTVNVGGGNKELQILKIGLGAEDVLDLLLDSGQQVMANSLPVALPSDQTPVSISNKKVFVGISVDTSAVAYHAGDCVGTDQEVAGAVRNSGGTATWRSLIIRDMSNTKPALVIILFDSDPSAGTYTDGSAMSISTDNSKIIRVIDVPSSAYVSAGGYSYADINIGQGVKAASGTSLYTVSMIVGAPTLTDNCLTYVFGFDQD